MSVCLYVLCLYVCMPEGVLINTEGMTSAESASAVHVYGHFSCRAHGVLDQCAVCVGDTNDVHVCFSLSTQFLCCNSLRSYIAHCVV